jgi:hypothetical protein
MMEPHLEDLRTEARYWRERALLYRAREYGSRPTRPERLRELERTAAGAEGRLKRAEAVAAAAAAAAEP